MAKAHVDVYGPDCHLTTYGCLCSELLLEAEDAKELVLPLLGEKAPPLLEKADCLSQSKHGDSNCGMGLGELCPSLTAIQQSQPWYECGKDSPITQAVE